MAPDARAGRSSTTSAALEGDVSLARLDLDKSEALAAGIRGPRRVAPADVIADPDEAHALFIMLKRTSYFQVRQFLDLRDLCHRLRGRLRRRAVAHRPQTRCWSSYHAYGLLAGDRHAPRGTAERGQRLLPAVPGPRLRSGNDHAGCRRGRRSEAQLRDVSKFVSTRDRWLALCDGRQAAVWRPAGSEGPGGDARRRGNRGWRVQSRLARVVRWTVWARLTRARPRARRSKALIAAARRPAFGRSQEQIRALRIVVEQENDSLSLDRTTAEAGGVERAASPAEPRSTPGECRHGGRLQATSSAHRCARRGRRRGACCRLASPSAARLSDRLRLRPPRDRQPQPRKRSVRAISSGASALYRALLRTATAGSPDERQAEWLEGLGESLRQLERLDDSDASARGARSPAYGRLPSPPAVALARTHQRLAAVLVQLQQIGEQGAN